MNKHYDACHMQQKCPPKKPRGPQTKDLDQTFKSWHTGNNGVIWAHAGRMRFPMHGAKLSVNYFPKNKATSLPHISPQINSKWNKQADEK